MNGVKPHMESGATETSSSGDFFDEWLEVRDMVDYRSATNRYM